MAVASAGSRGREGLNDPERHIVVEDLKLEHLRVVYPGGLCHPVTDRIATLPLQGVGNLSLASDLKTESRSSRCLRGMG